MLAVTNPKTGRTYTFGPAKRAQALALAEKLGVRAHSVAPRFSQSKTCICGRPEDTHESYDCHKDWNRVNG